MTRRLILVLGDQLGWDNPALADFDPAQDRLLMIEAKSEADEVWNHQARIAIFLSGMRPMNHAGNRYEANSDFVWRGGILMISLLSSPRATASSFSATIL